VQLEVETAADPSNGLGTKTPLFTFHLQFSITFIRSRFLEFLNMVIAMIYRVNLNRR
jgi:hypothetical protein